MTPFYELHIPYDEVLVEIQHLFDTMLTTVSTNVYFLNQNEFKKLPKLSRMLNTLNIINPWFMIVVVEDGEVFDPHCDNVSFSPWSLLLPIRNTKNSLTTFHKCKTPPYLKTAINNVGEEKTWWAIDIDTCVISHQIEVVKPTFINVNTPHGVINPVGNGQRQTLSISIMHDYDPVINAKDFII